MIESQSLSFAGTSPWIFGFAVLLLALGSTLAIIAMRRSRFKRSIVALEILRMGLLGMAAVAICQPEWVQSFLPESDPVLVVLWDQSDSMNTADMPIAGDGSTGDLQSRRAAITEFLEPDFWAPAVADRSRPVQVVIEPFSSALLPPTTATDIDGALQSTLEKHANLRGVVLLSDGSWNWGNSPSIAATQLRTADVPVFAVAVGSEIALPDLEVVSVEAPTFGVVNKPTRVPYTITSSLPQDADVEVTFSSSDGDRLTERVRIPANGTLQQAFVWSPQKIGDYE